MRLPRLLISQDGCEHGHSLHIHLRRNWLIRLRQLAQQFEVINVEARRCGKQDFCLVVVGVAECMWCSNRHDHVIARFGVDDFLVAAFFGRIGDVETDTSLCDVEGLVVHLVPVRWWTGCLGWHGQLCYTNSVIYQWFSNMSAKKSALVRKRLEQQVTRVGAILQNATGYRTKLEGLSSFCFDEIDVHVWNAHEAGHSAQRSEISVVTD